MNEKEKKEKKKPSKLTDISLPCHLSSYSRFSSDQLARMKKMFNLFRSGY